MELKITQLAQNKGQIAGLPANPRQWKKADVERLAQSIEETPELLDARPLIVIQQDDKYIVLGGNLRLAALKHLGRKTAPVYILPEDTPTDKQKEIVIKDNGAFGAWDFDMLANEWDDLPLTDWGVPSWETETEEVANVTEDDFDEDTDEIHVRCKPGDIWQLGDHRLMCGDSTDLETVKSLMGGAKADLVFTDPPYGTTGIVWDKPIDMKLMFDIFIKCAKEKANIILTGAQPFVTDVINCKREMFRYEIIWKKTQASGFFSANHQPLRIHENILVFGKGRGSYNPIKKVVGKGTGRVRIQSANRSQHYHGNHESSYVDDGTRYPTSVIEFSNWNGALFGNVEKAVVHPTQKPVELVAYILETYSNQKELVIDFFGGSGTTLIAAEQLDRKCYMMELDPHYCDIIIARWEKLTGKEAVKYGK